MHEIFSVPVLLCESARVALCILYGRDLNMGNILNPGNRNSFAEIVVHRYSGIFIDKTDFIGKTLELINRPTKFIAMT